MKKSKANYAVSRHNAVTHGFYATDEMFLAHLQPSERNVFQRMREALHAEYNPQREQEKALVERLAILYFRQLRLYGLEAAAAELSERKPLAPGSLISHLDRFSRYDTRLERQIRALHNRLCTHYYKRRDYSLSAYSSRE
jgi:hypothetical protein